MHWVHRALGLLHACRSQRTLAIAPLSLSCCARGLRAREGVSGILIRLPLLRLLDPSSRALGNSSAIIVGSKMIENAAHRAWRVTLRRHARAVVSLSVTLMRQAPPFAGVSAPLWAGLTHPTSRLPDELPRPPLGAQVLGKHGSEPRALSPIPLLVSFLRVGKLAETLSIVKQTKTPFNREGLPNATPFSFWAGPPAFLLRPPGRATWPSTLGALALWGTRH